MCASTGPTGPERVVVAIIADGAGRVLIARRPAGKPGAGLWEFPGGKVADGESEPAALARELAEELGITVSRSRPLPHFRADPPPSIRLAFWRVERYDGRPYGREGQEVRWHPIADLARLPFLAADQPILARLALPPWYLISDIEGLGEREFERRLARVLARGPALVQLREPWPPERLVAYAERLRALLDRHGAAVLINAPPEMVPAWAGVHLPARSLLARDARPVPPPRWLGASCHDARELAHAAAIGCDLAVLSPVLPTPSHPGATALGWPRFAQLAAATSLPVYALGGVRLEDCERAQQNGAQGVAVRSAVFARNGQG